MKTEKKPLTLKESINKIMGSKSSKKRWYPYEIQEAVKKRTGRMYDTTTITAMLRKMQIKAIPIDKKTVFCKHYYIHPDKFTC